MAEKYETPSFVKRNSWNIAAYSMCHRCFGYNDQTSGVSYFPYAVDMSRRFILRYEFNLKAFGGTYKRISKEGGIVNPYRIDGIVNEAYSEAAEYIAGQLQRLGEWFERTQTRRKVKSRDAEAFKDAISNDVKTITGWGKDRLAKKLKRLAGKNYNSDHPHDVLLDVKIKPAFQGRGGVTGSPDMLLAYTEPESLSILKLRGWKFTPEYYGRHYQLDMRKLAMEHALLEEDESQLERVGKPYTDQHHGDWDATEIGLLVPKRLRIISSDMTHKDVDPSVFENGLAEARKELKEYIDRKKRGDTIPWKNLPARKETCFKLHPDTQPAK